jgi:hypothetical protein
MLSAFYSYLKNQTTQNFLHWNMRDKNFGFQAIEHRYTIADYLLAADEHVIHILGASHIEEARLAASAVVRDDGTIIYPAAEALPQGRLIMRPFPASRARPIQPPKAMRRVAMIPHTARP